MVLIGDGLVELLRAIRTLASGHDVELSHVPVHVELRVLLSTHRARQLLRLRVDAFLVVGHPEEVLATDVTHLRLLLLVALEVLLQRALGRVAPLSADLTHVVGCVDHVLGLDMRLQAGLVVVASGTQLALELAVLFRRVGALVGDQALLRHEALSADLTVGRDLEGRVSLLVLGLGIKCLMGHQRDILSPSQLLLRQVEYITQLTANKF